MVISTNTQLIYLIILWLTLFVSKILMIAFRNRGIVRSGILFNFWFILVLCNLPEFRFQLSEYYFNLNASKFNYLTEFIYFILILFNLFLSCFADIPKDRLINVSFFFVENLLKGSFLAF